MTGSGDTRENRPPALGDAAVESVASAYYGREITAPDAARDRAERSATIAGAVGATLLGAGVISGIGGHSTLLTALGVGALTGWALAAALFVRAVGSPVERDLPEGRIDDSEFVKAALGLARAEVKTVNRRHTVARFVALAAMVLTIAALALAAFDPDDDSDRRTLLLTERGATTLARACGEQRLRFRVPADVRPATLREDFVVFSPRVGACSGEVHLDSDDVVAVLP